MYFGEDRNKVNNIVKPNLTDFRDLYTPYLKGLVSVEREVIVKKVRGHFFIPQPPFFTCAYYESVCRCVVCVCMSNTLIYSAE